jgi:uncharacterized membrane protein
MFNSFYGFLEKLGYTHPIHPMVTHITVGLTMATLAFALVSLVFRRVRLRLTAWHCALLAVVSVVPVAFFGFMDWQHTWIAGELQEGKGNWAATATGHTILIKMILAGVLFVTLLFSLLLGRRSDGESEDKASRPWRQPRHVAALVLWFVSTGIVIVLGYLGGNLVYS